VVSSTDSVGGRQIGKRLACGFGSYRRTEIHVVEIELAVAWFLLWWLLLLVFVLVEIRGIHPSRYFINYLHIKD